MIEYKLALCYGIIVSFEKIKEIEKNLTDYESVEFIDRYSRCINTWIGEDWFIGIIEPLSETTTDFVCDVSKLSAPENDDEDLICFKQFFDKNNLWHFIDWKPELLLINFCY